MATSYITDFIQSLSSEETKIVREYVYKSNNRPILGENKIEKLFDTLVGDPEKKFTDKELSVVLESNAGALRVLKSRLFDRVKEALLSDSHFENDLVFSSREHILFTLKKNILLAKSFYKTLTQDRIQTINFLLTETIKLAKENQIYDVLVEALSFQKYLSGIRSGSNVFKKNALEIIFYEHCSKCIRNANDIYFHVILNTEFINSTSKVELQQFIQDSIVQMKLDYKKTKAQEVNYYLHILQIAFYENQANYEKAITFCKKLLLLLDKSPVIYNKDRVGFQLGNLGQLYVYAGNFKKAIFHLKTALRHHLPNSFNFLLMKEQEFYAHFYAKNYLEAHKCNEYMLQHYMSDAGKYRKSKFIFFQAYLLFALKKFKEALQLLNSSMEIEKDKKGFNVSLRIIINLLFIELKMFKESSNSLANLRKYIDRNSKTQKIKERDVLILKSLRELEKDGFKRNEKNKTATKLLADLSNKDKPTAWNYFTPELIPFHEWVMALPPKNQVKNTV